MSHDRGCHCGREKIEYSSCDNPNCTKVNIFSCKHRWAIWPETDGLQEKCLSCGAFRATPLVDQFWKDKGMEAFNAICPDGQEPLVKAPEPATSPSPSFPFLFEVPAGSLRDEPLKAMLAESERYTDRCNEVLQATQEALKHAQLAAQLAAERTVALRNEFVRRRATAEREERDRQHNASWSVQYDKMGDI